MTDQAITTERTVVKVGLVQVLSRTDGSFNAECTRCGAGMGASAYVPGDGYDEAEDSLAEFTARHRECGERLDTTVAAHDAPEQPSPAAMPTTTEHSKTVWIVQGSNGSKIRVHARLHRTIAKPEGTELRFYDGAGDDEHRVATIRSGSWHWCVAEPALNPSGGEK